MMRVRREMRRRMPTMTPTEMEPMVSGEDWMTTLSDFWLKFLFTVATTCAGLTEAGGGGGGRGAGVVLL